jgi:hypothetical protein
MRSGIKGPEDVRAPTGVGGFEVTYDPADMIELVRIGAAVQFRNAIEIVDGRAVAQETGLSDLVMDLNNKFRKDPTQLVHAVSGWQWTEGEKTVWLARLESSVEERWSKQFRFYATDEGLCGVQALTCVDVDVKTGAQGPRDHLVIEVLKTPPDQALDLGRLVYGPGGPRDNRMILESDDVNGRKDAFGMESFTFEEAGSDMEQKSHVRLKAWSVRFKAGTATPPKIKANVQGQGPRIMDNARERYDLLCGVLGAFGFDEARLSFNFAGLGAEAVLQVGDGRPMVVADHEFGHVFGLKDEYAVDRGSEMRGDEKPAGKPSGHDELSRSQGLPGSVLENGDSLMSLGQALRPAYGAPFLWALKKVTRTNAWSDLKPAGSSTAAPDWGP